METELYEVAEIGKGKLFIMPKPSYWVIDRDMRYYNSMSIDKIVSLLEYEEADNVGLTDEQYECENVGIEFEQYPIRDGDIPKMKQFTVFVKKIYNEIVLGKYIAVHCWGGIGRSGVLTCSILKHSGYKVDDAVELVSEKREYPVPETGEQYNFLKAIEL